MKLLKTIYLLFLLCAFTIIFVDLLNEKLQYIPMLTAMYSAPAMLILFGYKGVNWNLNTILLVITGAMIVLSAVLNSESLRWSTVLYSEMFIFTYIIYTMLFSERSLPLKCFEKFLMSVIVAYAIVLVVQQVSVILNIPVFNRRYIFDYNNFKLSSLALEPSNTGPILTILMFAFVKIRELVEKRKISISQSFKQHRWVWISFLYVNFTCGSVACFFSAIVLLAYFLPKKHIVKGYLFFAALSVVAIIVSDKVNSRLEKLIPAVMTFNAEKIYNIDSSSSARIAPYIYYLSDIDLTSENFWIGHGCDYGKRQMALRLTGGYSEDIDLGIGGIINFLYDYGILSYLSFILYLISLVRFRSFEFLLYLLLFTVIPFNHYIQWLYFLIIYATKYYQTHTLLLKNTKSLQRSLAKTKLR